MVYNPNIPLSTDLLEKSVFDLKINYLIMNSVMAKNHFPFDDVTPNGGSHKYMSFVSQLSDPSTAASEIALYAKGTGTSTFLYMREQANGTVRQITGLFFEKVAGSAIPSFNLGYSTPSFGGFLIKSGKIKAASTATNPYLFVTETGASFPNNCFVVFIYAIIGSGLAPSFCTTYDKNGFSTTDKINDEYYFLAIGN